MIKTSKEKIDKRDFRFKKNISLNATIRLQLIENLFCVGLNVSNFSDPTEKTYLDYLWGFLFLLNIFRTISTWNLIIISNFGQKL